MTVFRMGISAPWMLSILILSSLSTPYASADYVLMDDYSGESLFSNFTFFTKPDPTEGFVKYLGESDAREAGLISVASGDDGEQVAYMGVDHTNLAPDGRSSVRITSKKAYNQGLFIADFAHVPGTMCGTWPAFWMLGPDWPHGGEIDIYEGVNLDYLNSMTLHTGPNCAVVPQFGRYTGMMTTTNCDVNAPDQEQNEGCRITSLDSMSFGSAMNAIGGGVFATEWTDTAISIWFLPRILGIPLDILSGNPQPHRWGSPQAVFTGNGCRFGESFTDLRLVFDTTFCGQWAGPAWELSPCAAVTSSCETFVELFPDAFRESYWEVKSVRVYKS